MLFSNVEQRLITNDRWLPLRTIKGRSTLSHWTKLLTSLVFNNYILVFFQGVTFIIGRFDEHIYYCVPFIFVSFHSCSFSLLEVAEPCDKLNKEVPVQVLAQLVEDEEVAKWTRPDEGLNLSLLRTCPEVPRITSSDLSYRICRKVSGKATC